MKRFARIQTVNGKRKVANVIVCSDETTSFDGYEEVPLDTWRGDIEQNGQWVRDPDDALPPPALDDVKARAIEALGDVLDRAFVRLFGAENTSTRITALVLRAMACAASQAGAASAGQTAMILNETTITGQQPSEMIGQTIAVYNGILGDIGKLVGYQKRGRTEINNAGDRAAVKMALDTAINLIEAV